jgi:uncharacterized repeat protein (TIGR01451 family)
LNVPGATDRREPAHRPLSERPGWHAFLCGLAGRPRRAPRLDCLPRLEVLEARNLLTLITPFAPRYQTNDTGDIAIVANTLMTAPASDPDAANAQNGVGSRVNNNDFDMTFVNVDGDPTTFDSSQSSLALPAGATVQWAGLYWGARSDSAARDQVLLATPGSAGYVALTGSLIGSSADTSYEGFLDVTSLVQKAGTGTYTVANVQATPGFNQYAGWALVVAYHLDAMPLRNLTVFDGYADVQGDSTTVTLNGFLTPPSGSFQTSVGVVAYEGDRGLTGDSLILNGTALTDTLNDPNNFFNSTISSPDPSQSTRGPASTSFPARNPGYNDQLGFDAKVVDASGILANSATSATIELTTSGDQYFPGVITTAIDVHLPHIKVSQAVRDLSRVDASTPLPEGGLVRPGDVLEYTLVTENLGPDAAGQVVLTDPLPAFTTLVPGSLSIDAGTGPVAQTDAAGDDQAEFDSAGDQVVFRLGTGATAVDGGTLDAGTAVTIRFRVRVNPGPPGPAQPADGTLLTNQATVTDVEPTQGVRQTTTSAVSGVTAHDVINQPRASPVSATTGEDTPVVLDVLAHASDPDGYPLSVVRAGPAAHGVVSILGDGTVSYVPDPTFAGSDSFPCLLSDGRGSVLQTVQVTVTPKSPVAGTVRASTSENTPVTINVLARATDPDGFLLTVTDVGPAVHGTTRVVNGGRAVFYSPEQNYVGPDHFSYTVSNGRASADGTVQVNITPNNAFPLIRPDNLQVPVGPGPFVLDVLANDSDPGGGPLTITGVTPGTFGSIVISGDGSRLFYLPDPTVVGSTTFSYTATDREGLSGTARVTVTMTDLNGVALSLMGQPAPLSSLADLGGPGEARDPGAAPRDFGPRFAVGGPGPGGVIAALFDPEASASGEISGLVFLDHLNGNGQQDPGEPGLPNQAVQMAWERKPGRFADERTTRTDADGTFRFIRLRPGTYRISHQLEEGMMHTVPVDEVYVELVVAGTRAGNRLFGVRSQAVGTPVAPAPTQEAAPPVPPAVPGQQAVPPAPAPAPPSSPGGFSLGEQPAPLRNEAGDQVFGAGVGLLAWEGILTGILAPGAADISGTSLPGARGAERRPGPPWTGQVVADRQPDQE